LVIRSDGDIVAGAQVLSRRLPGFGRVGQVPFGPILDVAAGDAPAVLHHLLAELQALMRQQRMPCVLLQPPRKMPASVSSLIPGLHAPDHLSPQLRATVSVDLAKSESTLLAEMHAKTRYNVRLAQRRGLQVRFGSTADLPVLHDLLLKTAERQGFADSSMNSLEAMWEAFSTTSALVIVEVEGRPVSAGLYLGWGDTVCYKRGAWSGEHGRSHPNELMHWSAMRWAKDSGFRFFDFEGVQLPNETQPTGAHDQERGVASFKLGFGGQVIVGPPPCVLIPSAPLRAVYRMVGQPVLTGVSGRRLLVRLRA
jgi:lipid II:glycine glycyltransferase (peptidoglycan interpeptide bridge formation enzyme)